jgi:hypothetical protein
MAELTPAAPARAHSDDRPGITLPLWLTNAVVLDAIFVVVVALAALSVRIIDLHDTPFGLHGDEAWTGLDARTIIDGGRSEIWPYTRAALGQPAGPMFWAVPFEALLGPSIEATRLPMAVLGALTIIVGFYAMRVLFGRLPAYAWAVLAAFSSWLIFYNRTGFTVTFMPFTEVASLLAVAWALKKGWWPWYLLAGVIVGAGIYGYYSYPLFAVGLGIWVLVHMAIERPRPFWPHARNVVVMGLMALLVIQPMEPYFFNDQVGYTNDRDVFAISGTDEYKAADTTSEKIDVYVDNAVDLARTLLWKGWTDHSDGSGAKPALDWIVISFAAVGLAQSLWFAFSRRRAAYLLPWIMIPLILIGPVWSFGGYHRRSLGILVFVLMAASISMAYMVESAKRQEKQRALYVAGGALVVVLAIYGAFNVNKYFDQREHHGMLYTYGPELTLASEWLADQPEDLPIYFFSDRWSINYETPRYFLDDRENKEDRSDFAPVDKRGVPEIEPSVGGIIALVGQKYIGQEDANISARYPQATRYEGSPIAGRPSFVAYVVSPD